MALGHKKMRRQEARRLLSRKVKQPICDPALAQLAGRACHIDLTTWITLADDIVAFRNNNIGHGFQLPPALERSLANDFVPNVEKFVDLVSYLNRNMLVYLESRRMTKTGTECDFRMLVHENPIFPRNSFSEQGIGIR